MVAPSITDNFSVSVVIPTYNRINFLPEAIDSVLSQSYPVSEVIVVDDGSTDNTSETLASKYQKVKFLKQENLGVSAARNTGVSAAKSKWIAFLDSDDQWETQKIEKQIEFLALNPDFKACHTGEKWIRNGNQVQQPAFLNKLTEGLFERSLERCIICPSSIILHYSVFMQIGTFDTDLKICEDYDFWIRLLLSMEIGLIDEPLVIKKGGHHDQLSTSVWGLDRFRVQSLEKIINSEKVNSFQRVQILKTIAHKTNILAKGFTKHKKINEAQFFEKKRARTLDQLSTLSRKLTA